MTSPLERFLGGFERSRAREYVLTTRLVHDLSAAAAASGYDLIVYLPTVDADGFDVVFDDRDRLVPIQLKSVVLGGKAASWRIRRSLIRPEPEQADLFDFESSPNGIGRGGGVILITVSAAGDAVDVRYAYTDLMILSAMWAGIIRRPLVQRKRLEVLRRALVQESDGSIEIPRSAFLRAASPTHLLGLAGLHSRVDGSWRTQMLDFLRHKNLGVEPPAPEAHLRELISEGLTSLTQA